MSVDRMEDIMLCAILIHKMCIEDRDVITSDYCLTSDEQMNGIIVYGRLSPMVCGLVRPNRSSYVSPVSASLEAPFEAR